MAKKTVLIIFGGQSKEHEVSRESAATILSNMNHEKYYILTLGITKEGKWLLYSGDVQKIRTGEWEKYGASAMLSPDTSRKTLMKVVKDRVKNIPIDVVFPVLHGEKGEDGAIQGLFEMMDMPYVGCGVLSSALAMDKTYTKAIVSGLKIKQAQHLAFTKSVLKDSEEILGKIEKELGFPCFVKPSNAGSSIGISHVKTKEELPAAVIKAFACDQKILVEKAVVGRELSIAVVGGEKTWASVPGEIVSEGPFYDYDAKYVNDTAKVVVPAPGIESSQLNKMQKTAKQVFKAVQGYGLSRVDFFLEEETGDIIFSEINTMPGFTPHSLFPLLCTYEGKDLSSVIDELIEMAFERNKA